MKNLIKKSLVVLTLMFALLSNASEKDRSIKIIAHDSKVVQLYLNNHDGSSELVLKDAYGIQLYQYAIKGKEFSKTFDLSELPDGNYFFELNGQTKIKTLPFSVALKKVEFNDETIIFKPIVRLKSKVVYISKFTLKEDELAIFLFDDNRNLLFSKKLSGKNNLNLKLNLKNLDPGRYKLQLKSEGKLYNEIIKVQNL